MAFFSLITPIFNKAKCLDAFISSIVEQSFGDFELICVDDMSSDESVRIIKKWMQNDSRIIGVFKQKNEGIVQARVDGLKASNGRYIWHLDPDDLIYDKHTLEQIKKELNEHEVDILQLGTEVQICVDMPEIEKKRLLASVKPYCGGLKGREVFNGCFVQKKFGYNVWNKIVPKSLWDRILEYIPKFRGMMSEDLFFLFLLTYFAQSYYGTDKTTVYRYIFNDGVSTIGYLSVEKFKARANQADVIRALKHDLNVINPSDTEAMIVLDELNAKMIVDSLYVWLRFVSDDIAPDCFKALCDKFSQEAVYDQIFLNYWEQKNEIIRKTKGIRVEEKGNIKTIGVYYYRMRNGGVEKVISLLIPMWLNKGYNVVLITDEIASPDDYSIPENVRRVVIKKADYKDNLSYVERATQLRNAIRNNNIDVVVYHAWNDPCMFWDMRTVQGTGAQFFVQIHLVFSSTISWMGEGFNYINYAISSADGVISITNTDYRYWSIYNPNTVMIPNPIDEKLLHNKIVECNNKNIIWLARFEDYKRPKDVFEVMKRVKASIPEARLIMLGKTENENDMKVYYQLRHSEGLDDYIEFAGFHKDVSEYYKNARLHLMTSEMEGFSMVLLESKSYGIPTVMYNLDYLDMVREHKGMKVSQVGDTERLANDIIKLLTDNNEWNYLSKEAKTSFEDMAEVDIPKKWDGFFKGISGSTIMTPQLQRELDRIIMELLNTEIWKRENYLLFGGGYRFRTALKNALKGRYRQTKGDIKMVKKSLKRFTKLLIKG